MTLFQEHMKYNYFLVDIDGTLTTYRAGALSNTLHGNFLFPIICDLMIENGWEKTKAEDAILNYCRQNEFWDYPDFLAYFRLPVSEGFRRFRQWHTENILPCKDGIDFVMELYNAGKKLFIMSNNPYNGCLFKLQAVGLAEDDFSSPYFCRIFGTNVVWGCKNSVDVWEQALARIPADKSDICTIGDNPVEERDIPLSCGIANAIILERKTIDRGIDSINKNSGGC